MKIMFITTTINLPIFIEDYIKDAQNFDFKDSVDFFVVGDLKTPPEINNYLISLNKKYGITINYWDNSFTFKNFPKFRKLIPDNSGVRRLIGHFFAVKEKYDFLISVDDDNFIHQKNYFSHMTNLGTKVKMLKAISENKFINIYDKYSFNYNFTLYHRGFPFSERSKTDTSFTLKEDFVTPVIKNSSVLGDPDIDAITRLIAPVNISHFDSIYETGFAINSGNWTPFNNQSTSFHSSILPAYFTPESGGRNADIWSSYVMNRLVQHFNKNISIGAPVVFQQRNPHNLILDLENELLNMKYATFFTDLLSKVTLNGTDYLTCLQEIISQIKVELNSNPTYHYIDNFFSEYQIWLDLIDTLK